MGQQDTIRDTEKVMTYLDSGMSELSKRVANIENAPTAPRSVSLVTSPTTISNTTAESTLFSSIIQGKSLQSSNLIEFEGAALVINPTASPVNYSWRAKYGSSVALVGPMAVSAGGSTTGRLVRINGFLKGSGSNLAQRLLAEVTIGSDHNVFTTNGLLKGFSISDSALDSDSDLQFLLTVQHGTALVSIKTILLYFRLGAPQIAA